MVVGFGRGEWIRTTDLLVPNQGQMKNQRVSRNALLCSIVPLLVILQYLQGGYDGE